MLFIRPNRERLVGVKETSTKLLGEGDCGGEEALRRKVVLWRMSRHSDTDVL